MNYLTLISVIVVFAGVYHCAPVDETNLKEPAALSELTHINTKATSMTDSRMMSMGKGSENESPNALKISPTQKNVEDAPPALTASSTTTALFIK